MDSSSSSKHSTEPSSAGSSEMITVSRADYLVNGLHVNPVDITPQEWLAMVNKAVQSHKPHLKYFSCSDANNHRHALAKGHAILGGTCLFTFVEPPGTVHFMNGADARMRLMLMCPLFTRAQMLLPNEDEWLNDELVEHWLLLSQCVSWVRLEARLRRRKKDDGGKTLLTATSFAFSLIQDEEFLGLLYPSRSGLVPPRGLVIIRALQQYANIACAEKQAHAMAIKRGTEQVLEIESRLLV